jgi:putative tryptophan/tyrosine transport system substrate-binding protein
MQFDQLKRREFIRLIGGAAAAWPLAARGQQTAKVPQIGYLAGNLATMSHLTAAFLRGLRELGYEEGHNIDIQYRDAEGNYDRLPALAADLVALKVDVIVVPNTPAALAAQRATVNIPIVLAWTVDPVSSGLVAGLARPGGNITGLSFLAPELVGKRLELLMEAVPSTRRVALLWHPGDYGERTEKDMLQAAEVAAQALGIGLEVVAARGVEDFDRTFSDIVRAGMNAVTVQSTNIFFIERNRLVRKMAESRLPAVYLTREFVDAGGLMSYSANVPDLFRRAASYVDKILKGARPSDLPVEQPIKFELVINLKTAKALGLDVPPSLLARADEVIE